MNTTDTTAQLAELAKEIAKAELAVENAQQTAFKLEQSDSWGSSGRLNFGRHAKAAFTRLEKRRRDLRRLRERHATLAARLAS